MGEWYDIKDRGIMGGAQAEIKEVTILGRTVRWTAEGIEYEADAGHRKKLMDAEGLEETSKSVVGPVMKENIGRQGAEEEMLEEKWEQKEFRSKGGEAELLGTRQERHPVRSEGNMPRDVEANGGRANEDKEGREVFGGCKEIGLEVHGKGG